MRYVRSLSRRRASPSDSQVAQPIAQGSQRALDVLDTADDRPAGPQHERHADEKRRRQSEQDDRRARGLGRVEREVELLGIGDGELDERLDVGVHGRKGRCLIQRVGGRCNAGPALGRQLEHRVEGRRVGREVGLVCLDDNRLIVGQRALVALVAENCGVQLDRLLFDRRRVRGRDRRTGQERLEDPPIESPELAVRAAEVFQGHDAVVEDRRAAIDRPGDRGDGNRRRSLR